MTVESVGEKNYEKAKAKLRRECRKAKEDLTANMSVEISVEGFIGEEELCIELTRA